jgi:chitin disaccharide deacetylase
MTTSVLRLCLLKCSRTWGISSVLQTKCLIVNADDFGQSNGINLGIIEAFENGIVTSASLMVRWPSAAAAARYARSHPNLSIGLHVDLGEWVYRQGQWVSLYEVVPRGDSIAVTEEVSRQLATFRYLMGREPSHIDSHQHVHRTEPVRSVLKSFARTIRVPLRLCSNVHYCGGFYGQTADGASLSGNISIEALKKLLGDLVPGITELGCHPAKCVDFDSMYTIERLQELEVLCDDQIGDFLAESAIQLSSFDSVSKPYNLIN